MDEKKKENVIIPEVLSPDEVTVFDEKEKVSGVHIKKDGKYTVAYIPTEKIKGKEDVLQAALEHLTESVDITTCSDTLQGMFRKGKNKEQEQVLEEKDFPKEKPWDVRMKELFEELTRLNLADKVKRDDEKKAIVWQPVAIAPKFYEPIKVSMVQVESITIIRNKEQVFFVAQKLTAMQMQVAKGLKSDLFMQADTWARKTYQEQQQDGKLMRQDTYSCVVKYDMTYAPNYHGHRETVTPFTLQKDLHLAKLVQNDLLHRKAEAERIAECNDQTAQVVNEYASRPLKRKFQKIKGFDRELDGLSK